MTHFFERRHKALSAGWLGLILLFVTAFVSAAQTVPSDPAFDTALLKQYCITCHNQRAKTGGLALDSLDYAHLDKDAETWEKVIRKIGVGAMPPQGIRRHNAHGYPFVRRR